MKKIAAGFLLLLALLAELAFAQALVKDTKHNLSTSGTGTIKAAVGGTTEICVFCHTPHGTSASVSQLSQLWNRAVPAAATYTPYTSDYLTGLGYPTAALGNSSRLCLSCHDGTVALGSVFNTPGSGTTGSIAMQNVTPITGTLPAGATNLTANLSDDHPVGHLYEPARNAELVTAAARPFPWPKGVQLEPNTAAGRVECKSCHDPHNNQFTKFLHRSNANAGLCTYCHTKTNYALSSHATSTQAYTPSGGALTTVGEFSCRSCHRPHTALGSKQLLQRAEEATCLAAGCHGTTVAPNTTSDTIARRMLIQPEMSKNRRHPTNDVIGLHKDMPFSTTTGAELPADLGSGKRHAECYDCHNPHQVQKPVAASPAEKSTRGALRISLALKGMWGVEPNWNSPAPLTNMATNRVTNPVPISFTPVGVTPAGVSSVPPITDEYQVCMKCHSNYVVLPGVTTNIAAQINPGNSSYHGMVPCPVTPYAPTAPLQNSTCTTNYFVNSTTTHQPWGGTAVFVANTGSIATPSVGSTEYNRKNPTLVANATATAYANRGRVWCSDCHGSELSTMPPQGPGSVPAVAAVKAAPYGAHGSNLTGIGPGTSNSDRMLVRTIVTTAGSGTPLCVGCHKQTSYGDGATNTPTRNNRHGVNANARYLQGCFTCHMWENPAVVAGGTGKIYPHGMNKKWAATIDGIAGSQQMVDTFIGGWQINMNYTTRSCWPQNAQCGGRAGVY